jgi:hypothetical protein
MITLSAARRPGASAAERAADFSLRPFATLARISLILGTLAGFGLGFLLLLPVAFRLPVALPWLPLVQVHGHVQILGFTTLFIFAVGSVIFPRFLNAARWDSRRALHGGLLLAAGVLLRALTQPWEPSWLRSILLVASGLLELAGPLLFASAVRRSCQASIQPAGVWQLALGIGFGSLALGLLLNLYADLRLAFEGLILVPPALDEAIITLLLRGFLVGVALAVSLKVLPQFLILRPPPADAFVWLLPGYAVGLLLTALSWILLEAWPEERLLATTIRATGDFLAFLALVGFVLALRLYEPAARESGRPRVTNPTRLWFRLAYAWLIGSALLNVVLSIREGLGGPAVSFTEQSAARHALTMGFLIVLLIGMASRILPGYSGWALKRERFLWWMIGLLLIGAALRVGGELSGGYGGVFGPITGVGGVLGTLGFLLFTATLWPALGHLPAPAGGSAATSESSCAAGCQHA